MAKRVLILGDGTGSYVIKKSKPAHSPDVLQVGSDGEAVYWDSIDREPLRFHTNRDAQAFITFSGISARVVKLPADA